MSHLTLAQARTLIDGALACARQHAFKPMGVVVVDAAAQAVASVREDGASALRLDIALGKAAAAIGFGTNSARSRRAPRTCRRSSAPLPRRRSRNSFRRPERC